MATNKYFNDLYKATDEDQTLYDDLITESIQVHGRDVHYLPRTLTNFDEFFGEDAVSAFNSAVVVEMQLENTDGWEGDGQFITRFGFEIREDATITVARNRFIEEVTSAHPEITKPREGDIIVLPDELDRRNRPFEIMHVSSTSVFYQLGELYVWTLTISPFEYNGEEFNTGIDNIDEYESHNSIATVIELEAGSGEFESGENVSQSTWAAKVVSHVDDILTVIATSGRLVDDEPIIGAESMATWSLKNVESTTGQDPAAHNENIKEIEDEWIDFSESDPFSGF